MLIAMHAVNVSKDLLSLRAVLKEWVRLNRLLGRQWSKHAGDLPWWYNERALLSLFAGAVWRTGGQAFEEFSELKRKEKRKRLGHGRVDLWFEAAGREFRAEAKAAEIPLSARARPLEKMRALMLRAVKDAGCNPADGSKSRRLALAFAVPYLSAATKAHELKELTDQFVAFARKEVDHDAIAWYFADRENLPAHGGWICPGIVVWVKLVKRSPCTT